MNYNELIEDLHKLNKQERFLKEHQEVKNDFKLIEKFNNSLNDEEKKNMLVPLLDGNYSDIQTLPASFFFSDNDPLNVKIIRHNRYTTPVMHNHDFYELMYVFEGEFIQHIGNKDYTMNTGDISLVPPNIYHMCDVQNNSIVLNVLIKRHTFQEIFLNNLPVDQVFANFFKEDFYARHISNFIIFHTYGDQMIRDIILKMYLETINRKKYYVPIVHSLLLQMMSYLLRHYEQSAITSNAGSKANNFDLKLLRYINDHYAKVTLEYLAEQYHYSPQYISKRIKNATGLSFNKYLTARKMLVAADLLKFTTETIADISEKLGYLNPETFIRAFKRQYKVTPNNYRHNKTIGIFENTKKHHN